MQCIRFYGTYCSLWTKEPYGIFSVLYHLHRDGKLSSEEEVIYLETLDWFETFMPVPVFYFENKNSYRAVMWFKLHKKTEPFIERLLPFVEIALAHGQDIYVYIQEIESERIVYADDYQIAVVQENLKLN